MWTPATVVPPIPTFAPNATWAVPRTFSYGHLMTARVQEAATRYDPLVDVALG
jgi:hypothetical protein